MSLTAVVPIVDDDLPRRLGEALDEYLALRRDVDLAPELVDALSDLVLRGGKRLRPTFAWWGWRAAGGAALGPDADAVVRALVSLELLQGCALVHDDVMDRSATRRGRPTAHHAFAARHRRERWAGDAAHYGDCAAILIGDLALVWADDALVTAGLPGPALARAWRPWQAMRAEMMAGQHLDLLGGAQRSESVEAGLRVARLKTAAYTVERPLHLGAAVADAPPDLVGCLRSYGRDVGVAFQLRDDLLGVFGDPELTGKPVGEDLREGKRTPLMATALDLARAAGRTDAVRALRHCLEGGACDEHLAEVRALLVELGAVAAIEERIAALTASGLRALDDGDLLPAARDHLVGLAERATARKR
ncbi:polyprenyl synthetase family protein [Actinosynnema sp. NPDC050436]|uniref:polyprenyl synthetase family protein n=1 Tax=Actinosynnema sp. NPDC050436 TaxID=3155659 RepID=UPI0033FD4D41